MLHAGLCSVTFNKKLDHGEICDLASRAGIHSIEWADIPRHVPCGNTKRATEVRRMSEDAGIQYLSFGSYYRVGDHEANKQPFEATLETALALGASGIRVWAGNRASDDADQRYLDQVAADACRIADLAAPSGVSVSFEYHGGTLTDTNESAQALMAAIGHENIHTYWQPPQCTSKEYRLAGLKGVLPWLSNIHVFHWTGGFWPDQIRASISDGADEWLDYLNAAAESNADHHALLEFVAQDDPGVLLDEAKILNNWVAEINSHALVKR